MTQRLRARHELRSHELSIVHTMHAPMPGLTVRIKRHPDGSASLTCTRADGTTTWQRQRGGYGLVFPSHDLTHFAVESTLGYAHGFYGLIADGWDIDDFAAPWPRGPISHEALEAELIVGFFDTERRESSECVKRVRSCSGDGAKCPQARPSSSASSAARGADETAERGVIIDILALNLGCVNIFLRAS